MLSLGVVIQFLYVHKHSCATFRANITLRITKKDGSVFQLNHSKCRWRSAEMPPVGPAPCTSARRASSHCGRAAAAPERSAERGATFPSKERGVSRQVHDVQVQTASSDSWYQPRKFARLVSLLGFMAGSWSLLIYVDNSGWIILD